MALRQHDIRSGPRKIVAALIGRLASAPSAMKAAS
jgi:hypothetical protein